MSDIRRVARDTKRAADAMSQVAVHQAYRHLDALTKALHRGRHDTWTAARDRAAKAAGITPSYAKRIWDRWQTMTDVSGGAVVALRDAYERICERAEAAEAPGIAEAERIAREKADEIVAAACGPGHREHLGAPAARADAQAPRPLR